MRFSFGDFSTIVNFSLEIPKISEIAANYDNTLVIADDNTQSIAAKICGGKKIPLCILKSGEENKNWSAVETILSAAKSQGLGRDGTFIAVGGGVIGDIAGFAASIYMRGCRFALVSTTLLGMVDASVGGKTGFDLFDIKNFAGTFYPAQRVFIPADALSTLPQKELKSGMAELIKTAVLAGENFLNEIENLIAANQKSQSTAPVSDPRFLFPLIKKAVKYKGAIVGKDFRETGNSRRLLNLGHTFGHALESAAGLGNITHGEAVAWGIVRACELGALLGVTPEKRAKKIKSIIESFGYETAAPHPLASDADALIKAMKNDKKKKDGGLTFIIPDKKRARAVSVKTEKDMNAVIDVLKGSVVV